ncbi:MAG TPA: hypothetical protein VK696_07725 [Steroidobacteraceae bacterium]|nr:hypothetical protein [Steroidobacteraceae bacterium]
MQSLIALITQISLEPWKLAIYTLGAIGLLALTLGASYVQGDRAHGRDG